MKKIGVKWVFKTKFNENGEVEKYKARLVVKGYAQQHGIDYTDVFAPVARWDTIRMIIDLAARNSWNVYQLDVKNAFLYGELKEAVFVEQPQGYEKKVKNTRCILKKSYVALNKPHVHGTIELKHSLSRKDLKGATVIILYTYK